MTQNGTIIRSIEEITISAKMNMQDMIGKAIALGHDFMDAKELLGHGKFLPWLERLGVSSSTASNYMRVAREIKPGTIMATLPYSKALALLSAPEEEREELAAQADDKSAAEIRRLIDERNRAAEAANTESARADQAEADAKRYYDEIGSLNTQIANIQAKLEKSEREKHQALRDCCKTSEAYERQKNKIDKLHEQLVLKENERVVVEKEVFPEDYEQLKRNQADLTEAAARAEERAAQLEEELEASRAGQAEKVPAVMTLARAINSFFAECDLMPFYPAKLQADAAAIINNVEQLEDWCKRMHGVLDAMAESKVVIV